MQGRGYREENTETGKRMRLTDRCLAGIKLSHSVGERQFSERIRKMHRVAIGTSFAPIVRPTTGINITPDSHFSRHRRRHRHPQPLPYSPRIHFFMIKIPEMLFQIGTKSEEKMFDDVFRCE